MSVGLQAGSSAERRRTATKGEREAMMKSLAGLLIVLGILTACAETKEIKQGAELTAPRERAVGYKVGAPYKIKGKWYYPKEDFAYSETGIASWYGSYFHGRATANGEIYNMNDLTAAHKTLQMPSMVRITNLENGRSLNLRVNDRGPFVEGRIIDVSRRASQLLGFHDQGIAKVKVEILANESRVMAGLAPPQSAKPTTAAPAVKSKGGTYATAAVAPVPVGRSTVQASADRPQEPRVLPRLEAARSTPPRARNTLAPSGPITGSTQQMRPVESVGMRDIYVQAGAFSHVDKAETARAQLRNVGPVTISAVQRDGRDLFRVRVGPLASEDEADRLLAAVVRAGFSTSQVVHE